MPNIFLTTDVRIQPGADIIKRKGKFRHSPWIIYLYLAEIVKENDIDPNQ